MPLLELPNMTGEWPDLFGRAIFNADDILFPNYLLAVSGVGLSPAAARDMSGKKKLMAHIKDKDIAFGSVTFTPDSDQESMAEA